jgi:hypothetical protein
MQINGLILGYTKSRRFLTFRIIFSVKNVQRTIQRWHTYKVSFRLGSFLSYVVWEGDNRLKVSDSDSKEVQAASDAVSWTMETKVGSIVLRAKKQQPQGMSMRMANARHISYIYVSSNREHPANINIYINLAMQSPGYRYPFT